MINQVILHGNTGVEPTVAYTPTGKMVCKFSLAVDRNYGKREADWFQIECWGKLAEVMQNHGFLGQELIIRGQIRTESYDKDGDTKYYTKIVASEIDIVNWKTDQDMPGGDPVMEPEHNVLVGLEPGILKQLQDLYAKAINQ